DGLPKSWKDYRVMDGGLPSVGNVLISAIEDSLNTRSSSLALRILKRIYLITYPFWIIQYKKYGSITAAIGLVHGTFPPSTINWKKLNTLDKIKLTLIHGLTSTIALITPVYIFDKFEKKLQKSVKKSK
ncbi:MAG: hypothetical protein KDC90_17020, partial [Ignavibacteriae bacterium]|nr:hypothetical protein [Ignavibacteriota bacterium]